MSGPGAGTVGHGWLSGTRGGAGDEDSRSALSGGEWGADVGASGGDHRDLGAAEAAVAGAGCRAGIFRAVRSAAEADEPEACAAQDGRTGAAVISGAVF